MASDSAPRARRDGMAAAHESEVDGYTDAVMAIAFATDLTTDEKRAKIRSLIEWLT